MEHDMAARTLYTAEEYARLPGIDDTELVAGEVRVIPPPLTRHGLVASNLYDRLSPFVRERRLGRCFTDGTGFHLPIPDATQDTVRGPDVSFVRAERLPPNGLGAEWLRLAPDLVAEVLSKSDTASELEEKVADYLSAGTRLLWAIDPDKRRVAVHSPAAPTRWLHERDTLDGDDVVPGFTMPVAELFEGLARSA